MNWPMVLMIIQKTVRQRLGNYEKEAKMCLYESQGSQDTERKQAKKPLLVAIVGTITLIASGVCFFFAFRGVQANNARGVIGWAIGVFIFSGIGISVCKRFLSSAKK